MLQWCDRCPKCDADLPEISVRVNVIDPLLSKTTTRYAERICEVCGHVSAPRNAQNRAEVIEGDPVQTELDELGYTNPHLHRRVKVCKCGQEWVCQLHKNIGPCDCQPGIECECRSSTRPFFNGDQGSRPSERNRPIEAYKIGVYGKNSHQMTDVFLHNEEQIHRELP